MKRFHVACLIIVVGLLLFSGARACRTYWADMGLPHRVVVGTLVEKEKNVLYYESGNKSQGSVYRTYWDSGWVEVEEVLFGRAGTDTVPIIWPSRCRLHPPIENCTARSSITEGHVVGEKRIWVLTSKSYQEDPYSQYYSFQAVHVDSMKRVISELDTLKLEKKLANNQWFLDTVLGK